jgi:hypothetical protein
MQDQAHRNIVDFPYTYIENKVGMFPFMEQTVTQVPLRQKRKRESILLSININKIPKKYTHIRTPGNAFMCMYVCMYEHKYVREIFHVHAHTKLHTYT